MLTTPPTRQGKVGYANPFQVGSTNIDPSNVMQYNKIDISSRERDKRPGKANAIFEGSPSANDVINSRIAAVSNAKTQGSFNMKKVQPEQNDDNSPLKYFHNEIGTLLIVTLIFL